MHPDFLNYSDEQVDAVVSRILEEVGLPRTYRVSIRSLVRSRAQNWRTCCGGTCNPCIGKIEEAVDRTRQILLTTGPLARENSEGPPATPSPTKAAESTISAERQASSEPESSSQGSYEDDEDGEDRNWGLDYA